VVRNLQHYSGQSRKLSSSQQANTYFFYHNVDHYFTWPISFVTSHGYSSERVGGRATGHR